MEQLFTACCLGLKRDVPARSLEHLVTRRSRTFSTQKISDIELVEPNLDLKTLEASTTGSIGLYCLPYMMCTLHDIDASLIRP